MKVEKARTNEKMTEFELGQTRPDRVKGQEFNVPAIVIKGVLVGAFEVLFAFLLPLSPSPLSGSPSSTFVKLALQIFKFVSKLPVAMYCLVGSTATQSTLRA